MGEFQIDGGAFRANRVATTRADATVVGLLRREVVVVDTRLLRGHAQRSVHTRLHFCAHRIVIRRIKQKNRNARK